MEVYIAIEHEPNYEMSTWKCLGAFSTVDNAQRAVFKRAFSEMRDFNVYDPQKRYEMRKGYEGNPNRWEDRWVHKIGVNNYRIEGRHLDYATDPEYTLHFNFDSYLKRRIIDERLEASAVRALLVDWKTHPEAFASECFSKQSERFKANPDDPTREAWIERHGQKNAYPFGDYDPL